ncbi:hypothetical protein VTO42DRAFT_2158 [Malbranchea cinnamomea]
MPGVSSFPVQLVARGSPCSHLKISWGYCFQWSVASSKPLIARWTSDLSFLESRRLHHDIASARSVRPIGKAIHKASRPSIWETTSFFTSNISCSGIGAARQRTFSSKSSLQSQEDDKANSSSIPKKPKILEKLPIPVRENIYTVPNILTFSRLAVAPFIGYFIINSNHVLALSLFAYASLTDLVDGWIARKFKQQTVVGTVIDPMADKTLMTVGVVCLGMNNAIPLWLAGLILSRDIGLAISALYYRWISLPPPKTMARYWDFSLPSAEVKPTMISKVNTALQLLLVGSAMTVPVLPEAVLSAWSIQEAMTGLQYVVAVTTAWSGLSYVYSKDAVKILSREEIEARAAKKRKEMQK